MKLTDGGAAETLSVQGLPHLTINPNITSHRVDGELVLVHLESNKIFQLSSSAGRFWEILNEMNNDATSVNVASVFEQMLDEYNVSQDLLLANITALVGELAKYEFVSLAGNA